MTTELPLESSPTVNDVISRLQREALADRRLLALAPEPELLRLVEASVQVLWSESRVKAFIPLLAMRRVREGLGMAEEVKNTKRDSPA